MKDPGTGGDKLSKSGGNGVKERNKSFEKVLDAQINWIRVRNENQPEADDLKVRWLKKSEWHEKEFGW